MIDLDNAHIEDDSVPNDAVKDIATAAPAQVPALEGQDIARDRHTKKIFVIDRSGSTHDNVAAVSRIGLLVWPDEVFEWTRRRIENAERRQVAADDEYLSDLENGEEEATATEVEVHAIDNDVPDDDEHWAALDPNDRDAIRTAVLRYNLKVPFDPGTSFSTTKYKLIQAVVARAIRERVHKFPDAKIYGIFFDSKPEHIQTAVTDDESGKTRYRPATAEEIIAAVYADYFNGGGTDITKGLASAVALCRRSPSAVKLHHVILITDGLDYGALDCVQFIEPMQKLGICLDVVHISDEPNTEVGALLKRVCEQTGGEYQVADDVEAFQVKLLNAAGRLLLTAGGAK